MCQYSELSFALPIYDLLDEEDEVLGKELIQAAQILNIKIDMKFLMEKYDSYGTGLKRCGKGDVVVFYNNINTEIFIMIDLYNGCTDQNNMVYLGVRCPVEQITKIKRTLTKLYDKSEPRSEFVESNSNNLKNIISTSNYPKEIMDCMGTYRQQIEYYVDGKLKSSVK